MVRITVKIASMVLGVMFLSAAGLYAQEGKKHIRYETPTLSSLSKLYWAISKLDLENDTHVDNYMLINECSMYRDFYHNELEWGAIREAAREYLRKNQKKFPVYLEYMQLIHLAEYNPEKQFFEIFEEDRIMGGRSFELLARDADDDVCGKRMNVIEAYPKGLYVELNRPVVLDKISVPRGKAEKYIEEKLKIFNNLPVVQQDRKSLYRTREAYVSMKLQVLTYDQDVNVKAGGTEVELAKIFANLDGYSVYGDKEKQNLLYTESYRGGRDRPSGDLERRKLYQERLKRHGIIKN